MMPNTKLLSQTSLTLGLLFSLFLTGMAQDLKKEYEKAVKVEEMPRQVLDLVSPLIRGAKQIAYYKEYTGGKLSYEIKMDWQGKQLSVEFYEDGRLMDIEQLITMDEIRKPAREQINAQLNSYRRYKITRLQRQYSAQEQDEEDEKVIGEFMEGDTDDLTIRYEMVVYLKGKGKHGLYELLFDDDGILIETQRVERRSPDNVLY